MRSEEEEVSSRGLGIVSTVVCRGKTDMEKRWGRGQCPGDGGLQRNHTKQEFQKERIVRLINYS